MPWECITVANKRNELVTAYMEGVPMTDLCRQYRISRKTGYKWVNRWKEIGQGEDLTDRSKARIHSSKQFSDEQIGMTLHLKHKYRSWGPRKIIAKLTCDYPDIIWPSPTRLYEIFKEYGLTTSRKFRQKIARTAPLGDISNSNQVWMADFKGWVLTADQHKFEPLTITDGHTRYLIRCTHLPKKNVEYVWSVFDDAFHQYGLPNRVRTDNGPPFGSMGVGRLTKLSVNLIKAGVTPEWINPGHPEENGRHERFHLTLKMAIASPPANNLKEQIARSRAFEEEYNFERPHEALDMKTPSSQYTPSIRKWDGVLRPMEYEGDTTQVRKVGQNGCIWFGQREYYLGQTLSGEYVALKQDHEKELNVHYGPINLGKLKTGGIEKAKRQHKKIYKRVR